MIESIKRIHNDLGNAIEKLSNEHAFQQVLLENAPIIIISTDRDGIITYMNRYGEQILGYSKEEIIQQCTPLIFLHARELNKILSFRRWTESETQELTFVHKDGKEFICEIKISPIKSDGNLTGFLLLGQDVTDKKQNELDLKQRNEELTAIEEKLRQNLEELEATQEELVRKQIELTGQINALHNAALVSETDIRGNIIFANETFAQVSGYTVEEFLGKNHRILKSGKQDDAIFVDMWATISQGKVWRGIICDKKKNGEFYWVKSTITPVLDNQGIPVKYIAVRFEITEQVEQQIELTGQINALHNAALVSETDIRGNIIFANETFAQVSGYTVEEFLGKNHRILKSGKQDDAIFVDMWATISAGKVWRGIICNKKKNGEFYWVKSTITPVLDNQGIPVKYIAVRFEITEQVEQQIELTGQINALHNAALVSETDIRGNIIFANETFAQVSGYTVEEFLGKNHRILKSGKQDDAIFVDMWATISAGKVWRGIICNKKKNGEFYWVKSTITPVLDNQCIPVKYIGVRFEITEQVEQEIQLSQRNEELTAIEEELRQNLEELEATQEELVRKQIELTGQLNALHNAALVSETDIRGNIIFANETFAQVSGYTVEEFLGKNHRILKSGKQDDAIFVDMWATISQGKVWRGIICNKKKNGEFYWVKSTITPVLDNQGIPVKYIGVRFEITEQVEQEIQLSQRNEELTAIEEQLRQNLEELEATQEELVRKQIELTGQINALHNAALVSETDIRGNIIFANETFAQVSGYTVEEFLGKNHRILKSGKQDDAIFVDMWATISAGKVWRGIICNKKKNGEFYWVKSTITPVLDNQGIPVKYIAVRFEITEQVEQEIQLSQRNEELTAIEEQLRQNLEELEATQEELVRKQIELTGQINALHNAALVSETDIRGNIIFANETFAQVSGYTVEELLGKNHRILKSGKQDDAIFVDMWATISAGKVWRGIICNKKKNGEFYWVKSTVTPVLDNQSIPVKYIGVRFEITEQVELSQQNDELEAIEEELRQNLEELEATQEELVRKQIELTGQLNALHNAAIVSETDIRGNIIFTNETFAQVSGYTVEELLGKNHRILKSGKQDDAIFVDLWATISAGKVWRGIICNKKKNGEFYWVKSTITPVLDNQGIPVKYIGVRFEITEQVELQRKTEEQSLELKKTFSQMIQNEKMATLGQLVAGVAHEINTPLGAINAAANNIADNFLNIIILFVKNLQIIEQNPQLFLELCSYLAQPKDALSSREERQLKKKLTSILEENGIENAEDIASELAAIAFTINLEPYMTLFQLQNKDLEELLFSIGRTAINTSSIYTAVKKTQKIISALKSYSYQKNYDQKEAVDINDTLDNILTIYNNQTKHSVEVIREFQELPKIHVFVDEIGQVWNNLIVNALQAMKYQGRLIIQTYPETDKIVVKIIDNGPGIPKEIQDKIFEPFFTTKPQGEGTGLGLDICKKIVEEKHHGKIEVFSEPGCTCFTVTLPLEQN